MSDAPPHPYATRASAAREPAPEPAPAFNPEDLFQEFESRLAARLAQVENQSRRISLPNLLTPTRVRDDRNPSSDSDSFSLTRLFKYLKDGVKFTGQGKVPTQDLFNLQIAMIASDDSDR